MERSATVVNKTDDTDIAVMINLDGRDHIHMQTGVDFFDHILTHFARRAGFDMTINVQGEKYIDPHHIVEDVGVVIGQAISRALKERKVIRRNSTAFVPIDDALVMAVADINGRAFLGFEANIENDPRLPVDVDLVEGFLRAIVIRVNMNIHVRLIRGHNAHHCIEAIFKAVGQSIGEAVQNKQGTIIGI